MDIGKRNRNMFWLTRIYFILIILALSVISICGELKKFIEHENPLEYKRLLLSASSFPLLSLETKQEPIPKFVDWRNVTNRVTTVKDQKKCQAAWAFAAAGLLEGQLNRIGEIKGDIVSLSAQNLIDCSIKNDGCLSGSIEEALNYVKEFGIQADDDYPFRAAEQICRRPSGSNETNKNAVYFRKPKLSSYGYLPEGDIEKLKEVLARYGPVASYMDASDPFFMELDYRSDVYYNKDCLSEKKHLNHPILIVGYGSDSKNGDYWIVKNSWGWADWARDGFAKVSSRNNHCGLATMPIIAIFQ